MQNELQLATSVMKEGNIQTRASKVKFGEATTVVQEATLEPLGGDVAVSRVLAQPRWKVRLRESVPLREGKRKGVNAACRWGAG